MTELSGQPMPPGGGARGRMAKRLRRLALLIAIIVGVLGGVQIYQITLASKDYVVVLRAEADIYGTGSGASLDTQELLRYLEYELLLPKTAESLLELPVGRQHLGRISLKGRDRQKEVSDGRVEGVVRWPGAASDRLTLTIEAAEVRGDTIVQILTHEMTRRFLGGDVEASLAVRNQDDDPVDDLERPGVLTPSSDAAGIYRVSVTVDDLFWRLTQGDENYSLNVRQRGQEGGWTLEIPLAWFLAEGESSRVITVQQQTKPHRLDPVAERLSPQSVTAGAAGGWDGRLRVEGVDLDLVEEAYLQRGQTRIPLRMASVRSDHVLLDADPSSLRAGSYQLFLDTGRAGGSVRVPQSLRVESGLWWTEPKSGITALPGEVVSLRWGSSSSTEPALVEGARSVDDAAWTRIAELAGVRGSFEWTVPEELEEGPYVLRLRVLGRDDLAPRLREIEVLPPPTVRVVLRFRKNGAQYGRINGLWIDDQKHEIGSDPKNVFVRLTRGEHRWKAAEPLLTHQGRFVVDEEGQKIDLELDR